MTHLPEMCEPRRCLLTSLRIVTSVIVWRCSIALQSTSECNESVVTQCLRLSTHDSNVR
jgi:hypothetical protein